MKNLIFVFKSERFESKTIQDTRLKTQVPRLKIKDRKPGIWVKNGRKKHTKYKVIRHKGTK